MSRIDGLSQDDDRAPSPETVVKLSTQENLGPSEEDESEFAKELAKMVTDTSTEARKVDKRTALALLDSAVLASGILGKKRAEGVEDEVAGLQSQDRSDSATMNFTVITKRGNKQQVLLLYGLSLIPM